MTSSDLVQLGQQVQIYADRLRQSQIRRLGHEPVTWLAMLPQWTARLATHCGFPAGADLTTWLDDAAAAGLCNRQVLFNQQLVAGDEDDETAGIRFWMSEDQRVAILAEAPGRIALRDLAATIGRRIREAPDDVGRDPGIDRWADLAVRAADEPHVGDWLMSVVAAHVADNRMPEALDWLYAAEALSPVLGEEVASAADRARRLTNIEYRRRLDRHFLERFLYREEQVSVVKRLVSPERAQPWAIHLIGMAGVGKTMLIRYLTGGFGTDLGIDLIAAQVDFDHVSPWYPTEAPAQLLRELAAGLSTHLRSADQASSHQHLMECIELIDNLTAASPDLGGIRSVEFELALSAFASFVTTFEQRVLLILDTCEELAKLRTVGERVPSIEYTFEILERLHDKAPFIRVVLAGRRLLARSYANLDLGSEIGYTGDSVSDARRDYLELVEVRGFTDAEARKFLTRSPHGGRDMPAAVQDAILRMAPDNGRIPAVATALPDSWPAAEAQRFNPFELTLYADWFDEFNGTLTAAEIESGGIDAYVKGRVVTRLPADPPVARVLPVLATLGRVDRYLVRVALDLPAAVGDRVFRSLAEQEWISARMADESGVTVLDVQPGLLQRLRRYVSQPDQAVDREAALSLARRQLPQLIDRRPLDGPAIEHAAAVTRLLPEAEGAVFWEALTRRVCGDGAWAWAANACARLLVAPPDGDNSPLSFEAAVRAVYIGAMLRLDPSYDAAQDWEMVEATAPGHPVKELRSVLHDRAVLGRAAALARRSGRLSKLATDSALAGAWARVCGRPNVRTAPAALAMVSAYLEMGVAAALDARLTLTDVRSLVNGVAEVLDPGTLAVTDLLLARLELHASGHTDRFADAARRVTTSATRVEYLDWPLPHSAAARVRLEWMSATAGFPQAQPPMSLMPAWLDEALHGSDVEHERIASAIVLQMLAHRVVAADLVAVVDRYVRSLGRLMPLCRAHVATPPLVTTVVRAWLDLGQPSAAQELLQVWEDAEFSYDRDAATTAAVELVAVHIARRMRWRGMRESLLLALATTGSARQIFAARAARLLLGEPQDDLVTLSDATLADVHWRTTAYPSGRDARDLLASIATATASRPAPEITAHLLLDGIEAHLVARRRSGDFKALVEQLRTSMKALTAAASGSTNAAGLLTQLRILQLRQWALVTPTMSPPVQESPHEWAHAALEEGELLALRLPRAGERLLDLAVRLFDKAGNEVGAMTAATLAVMATFRVGRHASAASSLVDLESRYGRLRALYEELPPWSALRAWDFSRQRLGPDDPWHGWLSRLALCIAVGKRRAPRAFRGSSELDLSARRCRYRVWQRLKRAGHPKEWSRAIRVMALLLAAVAATLTVWAQPAQASIIILALIAVLSAVVAITGQSAALLRVPGARFRLVALVHPVAVDGADSDLAEVDVRVQPLNRRAHVAKALLGPPSGLPPGPRLPLGPDPERTRLPQPVADTIAAARVDRDVDELALSVHPSASGGAWEAVVELSDPATGSRPLLATYRSYPAQRPRLAPDVVRVAVLCPLSFGLFAEESWVAGGITPKLFHARDLRSFERVEKANVLHMVATPLPEPARSALVLDDPTAQEIKPDRLPLTTAGLIVVQAEPGRSSVSVDPRSALLKTIAHSVAVASGGAAVLVIPALPIHLARSLVAEIGRRLARDGFDRRTLIDLTRTLQEMVFAAGDPQLAWSRRAVPSLDLCLYLGE
ncbi:ATP-binding protein [Plantactinospora sp. KBS50]|uniref:ATP-binding protein n=1 Tax=Plantactinospora sp. KBS50 TaxID=2024580 RepID=UPI000BAAE962|nr:ATP-binding protein [Plantactinospora sp. KBS50]ASW55787.1 hypothetical protein CIK06_18805 [Plantactinospora sp. KBS50]